MRKYSVLVVLMALILAVTSGCGLIVKDPEVDAQTVIIEVAGKTFVKADVLQTIENVLDYQEYYYAIYGYNFDRTDPDAIESAQETAINSMIEEAVSKQKITEYGLDQFSTEELATLNEQVDETYEGYVDSIVSSYFSETELTGEELDTAVEAKLVELGYGTKADILEQEKQTVMFDKLRDMIVQDVEVSEDEIETRYTEGVADAEARYASYPTQFAADSSNGAIIYAQPSGYRYIKNLLIQINSEDKAKIAALNTQIASDQNSLAAVQEALNTVPEESEEDTAETIAARQKSLEETTAQAETLTAEIEDLTQQLDELTADAYGAIQSTVNMVLEKINAGEDFDALIEEFGEDTGMTVEPTKSTGYLVCDGLTTYLDAFVDASMALKDIGDISMPFRTEHGVHIVQYASDLEAGQIALADIHDQISEELLTNKQNDVYDETITQWITEANAKVYANRLAD